MTKAQAVNLTVRAVELSRRAADNHRPIAARKAWSLACRFAFRCGGLSGSSIGGSALLIQRNGRDYVVYAPIDPRTN